MSASGPVPRASRSLISRALGLVLLAGGGAVGLGVLVGTAVARDPASVWSHGLAVFTGILIAAVLIHLRQRHTLEAVVDQLKQEVASRASACDLAPLPPTGASEIDPLVRDLNTLLATAQRRLQVAAAMETAARARAAEVDRDRLTGLYNRGFLVTRLADEVMRTRALNDELSLIMLDVDHFKHYNDTHGHQRGDEILQGVSALLTRTVRAHDVCVRYGGEEFLILLPRTSLERARRIAERIRATVEEHPFPGREQQPGGRLTVSLGLAALPAHAGDGTELIARADEALYAAKQAGRNRVVTADEVRGRVLGGGAGPAAGSPPQPGRGGP